MKKVLFIFLFCPFFIIAQQSSFIYELHYKYNADSTKTEKIVFFLDVKNKESVFRSDKFRISDSLTAKRGFGNGFDMQFNNKQLYVVKNIEKNEAKKYVFVPLIFSVYSIQINENLVWEIKDEKMKIGKFECQKAITSYGGRKWFAWFTNEIPIQDGPYIFQGLPGLIVSITDDNNDYQFKLGEIKSFKWKDLHHASSKKNISWEEFKKIQRNFYDDPIALINKSDIKSYDDAGAEIKTDYKVMREGIQERIRGKNNPLELNQKIEYR